jgi:hypothetical protein
MSHYGLTLMGEASALDYRLTGDFESGKIKAGATDVNLAGTMFDVELGYGLPEFMKSRVYVTYHTDSGADSSTNDKAEQYIPLFYDTHKYAGLMDTVTWGNLTQIGIGLGLNPSDDLNVGIQYNMFSRTTDKGAKTVGTVSVPAAPTNTEKVLGSEIDLTATKSYSENFSIYAQLGTFMPGEAVKKANADKGDSENQIVVQGKLTF